MTSDPVSHDSNNLEGMRIRRTLYPEVPPRVEYELTVLGRSFLVPMKGLIVWADEHHRVICQARAKHAARTE